MRKVSTLCIIHQHPNILLGFKKKGFGEGKWNGFGGKVERGETIEEAARREVEEEAGIVVDGMRKVGVVDFEFKSDPEILHVHIFLAKKFFGEPRESEEMRPAWFDVEQIPYEGMWLDDKHWLPLLLSGKKFRGRFLFDGFDTIVDKNISIVRKIV